MSVTIPPPPLRASVAVPATADVAAIVLAAGGSLANALYSNGVLTVDGVAQEALEAAAGPADPLFAARFEKKRQAADILARKIVDGMPWLGKVISLDQASIVNINAVVSLAQAGGLAEGVTWRTADNTPLALDAAGMVEMGKAAGQYYVALRMAYWAHVDAAKAAPDAEALAAVDPTTGWPDPPVSPD